MHGGSPDKAFALCRAGLSTQLGLAIRTEHANDQATVLSAFNAVKSEAKGSHFCIGPGKVSFGRTARWETKSLTLAVA